MFICCSFCTHHSITRGGPTGESEPGQDVQKGMGPACTCALVRGMGSFPGVFFFLFF